MQPKLILLIISYVAIFAGVALLILGVTVQVVPKYAWILAFGIGGVTGIVGYVMHRKDVKRHKEEAIKAEKLAKKAKKKKNR